MLSPLITFGQALLESHRHIMRRLAGQGRGCIRMVRGSFIVSSTATVAAPIIAELPLRCSSHGSKTASNGELTQAGGWRVRVGRTLNAMVPTVDMGVRASVSSRSVCDRPNRSGCCWPTAWLLRWRGSGCRNGRTRASKTRPACLRASRDRYNRHVVDTWLRPVFVRRDRRSRERLWCSPRTGFAPRCGSASERNLQVIDAACAVTKVHNAGQAVRPGRLRHLADRS